MSPQFMSNLMTCTTICNEERKRSAAHHPLVASNDTAKLKELDRINTKHTKALEIIIKAGYENCN